MAEGGWEDGSDRLDGRAGRAPGGQPQRKARADSWRGLQGREAPRIAGGARPDGRAGGPGMLPGRRLELAARAERLIDAVDAPGPRSGGGRGAATRQ